MLRTIEQRSRPAEALKAQGWLDDLAISNRIQRTFQTWGDERLVPMSLEHMVEKASVDGRFAILNLRDELLLLVSAYNAVGSYRHAAKAQSMAVALHEFEDTVVLTHMAWPPRVERDEHGPFIPDLDGKPMDTGE